MNTCQHVEPEDDFLIKLASSDKPTFYTSDKITIMFTCRDNKIQLLSWDTNVTVKM